MILWIDGPYGVGKTTLAREIWKRIQDCFIFDAELVGNAVRENMPSDVFYRETFEGYDLWFETCIRLLSELVGQYDGVILVPMTLMDPASFDRFRIPLERQGIPVKHLMLEADRESIRNRILQRGEEKDCWCMRHIDVCLTAQQTESASLRLNTDGKPPEGLAEEVVLWLKQNMMNING